MMAILHSITSSRNAAAHMMVGSSWPSDTQLTTDDILIHGDSLAAAARARQTPLVRIGEARTSPQDNTGRQEFVTVLVTRVEHVDHLGLLQRPDIWIDAALSGCSPIVAAARIIGRPTTERRKRFRMLAESDPGVHTDLYLPADIRTGDLVAIPCAGTVPRSQVTSHRARPSALTADTTDDPTEDTDYWGVCGK